MCPDVDVVAQNLTVHINPKRSPLYCKNFQIFNVFFEFNISLELREKQKFPNTLTIKFFVRRFTFR